MTQIEFMQESARYRASLQRIMLLAERAAKRWPEFALAFNEFRDAARDALTDREALAQTAKPAAE